jgi:hypothetical protein
VAPVRLVRLQLHLPQIHDFLPPSIPSRTLINRTQTLDTGIEIPRAPLALEVKGDIALLCRADSKQALGHRQVHPRLAGMGQYAALFTARLEERGVLGRGEDEDGFEGSERDECADDGWG